MYKRVLVAVDGSDTSNLALREAIRMAKNQHSTLRLLHVVDLTMAYSVVEAPYIVEYQKALRAEGEKLLSDCSEPARAEGIEFDTKLRVAFGEHLYDVIEDEAKQWSADLIVIGTHGRRGMRRLLLGSVAEGLIRISSKPVLLIRGGENTSMR
jgi:nucleotide-binding universal stress UspA family protein